MAETVKFIHAADLHLGAPFRGFQDVSEKWANKLIDAIPEAFERMIQAALDNEVDFMVIAGDVFDLGCPSYDEYLRFIDGMERLEDEGIPVYVVAGNHDPLSEWEDRYAVLPSNVHVFDARRPSFFTYERDGRVVAVLGGRSYLSISWPSDQCIAQGITRAAAKEALGVDAPFAIGVLHTGLDIDPYKAPVNPKVLANAGMDYWALGHVHSPRVNDAKNPTICFSGCIQGRAIKEVGPHGVNLVTLARAGRNKVEAIPTQSIAWAKVKVDASKALSIADLAVASLEALYKESARSHSNEMIARVTLSGATHLHDLLKRADVLEGIRKRINDEAPHFFCDVILNKTKTKLHRKALRKEGLFPATLLAVGEQAAENPKDDYEYLQTMFLEKGIDLPNLGGKRLSRLADEAETVIFDLLGGEQ